MFIQNKIFSRCYSVQAEIWKDDSQLGCASDPIYSFAKKINTLSDMASRTLLFC